MDIRDVGLPTVAVTIATYKRPGGLERALDSLAHQYHTDFKDIHVFVVNDGSHDGYYQAIISRPWPFELTYIPRDRDEQDRPHVYSSRNLAVKESRGEVIWIVDDDLYFDEHTLFILRLYHALLAEQRPVLIPHNADRQEPWHYQNPFPFFASPRDHLGVWVSFAGASVWRKDWERVGGIDEAYDHSMGFADMDLGIRLFNNGCNVFQVDGISCFIEDGGVSWRTHFIRKLHPDGIHPNGELYDSRWPEYRLGG